MRYLAISIDNNKVSHTAWGSLDHTALRDKLMDAVKNGEGGAKKAVDEAYLYVGDDYETAPSENLKYPHHQFEGNTLILNREGVGSAASYLVKNKDQMSSADYEKAVHHLMRHYRSMGIEPPDDLSLELTSTERDYIVFSALHDLPIE